MRRTVAWGLVALAALPVPACARPPQPQSAARTSGAMPAGKRVAPPAVQPLVVDGLRIAAVTWSRERGFDQNGGVIEAFDAKTGASLWLLEVYDIAYIARLENDVQDVFITRLRRAGQGRIRVDDENGRQWIVDLATRTARAA